MSRKKTETLVFRVAPEMAQEIRERAVQADRTTSQELRRLVRQALAE